MKTMTIYKLWFSIAINALVVTVSVLSSNIALTTSVYAQDSSDANSSETPIVLNAPDTAQIGDVLEVTWTGPAQNGDFIRLAEAGSEDSESVTYNRIKASSLILQLPLHPGDYVLRYVTRAQNQKVAERPIKLVDVTASLEVPSQAVMGTRLSVKWQGPGYRGDYLSIVTPGAETNSYGPIAGVRGGSPVSITVPNKYGQYEIRYIMGQGRRILARSPLKVIGKNVSLEVPTEAPAGSLVKINWTGPDGEDDFVTAVPASAEEGERLNYALTSVGSPMTLLMPDVEGEYELRYTTGKSNKTLAAQAIKLTTISASLKVPKNAPAGGHFTVDWQGPGNPYDLVTIVPPGAREGDTANFVQTNLGSPAELRAPDETGPHEVRYLTGQTRRTLATAIVDITPVKVSFDIADRVAAGEEIEIKWDGPNYQRDFITIVPANAREGSQKEFIYSERGSPIKLKTPDEPGDYEVRYVSGQSRITLARQALTLTSP